MVKSFIENHMNVSALGNCTIFTMNNLSEMVSIFKFPTCLLRILECYYVIESVSWIFLSNMICKSSLIESNYL